MSRRLAAIMVADCVGYSRLIGMDEAGTLARLSAARREVIDPQIAAFGGRIFKTMGDALLVEFPSVVDAVRCALALAEAKLGEGAEALLFRFGVHMGDVVDEAGDLFGDAVNVAARIEAEAWPGGIVVSEDAARYARGKIGAALTDLGLRRLKNIAQPVRLYAAGDAVSPARAPGPDRIGRPPTLAMARLRHLGDPDQAHLTDGLTERLTSALAQFELFDFVERADAGDYLLEGSVQVAGPRARITVHLSEHATGRRVWGQTFAQSTEDPFALQDDMAMAIASIMGEAIPDEAVRALDGKVEADYTAHDWAYDALRHLHRLDREGCRRCRASAQLALDLAPDLPIARMVLGFSHMIEVSNGWPLDRPDALAYATDLARDLVRTNERSFTGWRLLARLCQLAGRLDEALLHIARARGINPYETDGLVSHAQLLTRSGRAEEGLPLIERACRVNPHAPTYYIAELGLTLLMCGQAAAALTELQRLSRPVAHSPLTQAVALIEMGRLDAARELVRGYLDETPDATVASAPVINHGPTAARYADALRRAGLADAPTTSASGDAA